MGSTTRKARAVSGAGCIGAWLGLVLLLACQAYRWHLLWQAEQEAAAMPAPRARVVVLGESGVIYDGPDRRRSERHQLDAPTDGQEAGA